MFYGRVLNICAARLINVWVAGNLHGPGNEIACGAIKLFTFVVGYYGNQFEAFRVIRVR